MSEKARTFFGIPLTERDAKLLKDQERERQLRIQVLELQKRELAARERERLHRGLDP